MTTPPVTPTVQAAKPFEPITVLQPKPPAPSFANWPNPEWEKWKPATDRGQPQPPQQQQQPPTANGNNFWNIFDRVWNRNKPQAPSLFQNDILNKPVLPRVQPETMQTSMASSSIQYHNINNQPFQAQTSAYQTGFNNPPSANFIVSPNTLPSTYQGHLSTLDDNGGSSFLYIDGKPYVIRRVINRFSNTFTPGNLNIGRFQPFLRFGPGFMRGDQIPHVIRQALRGSQVQKTQIAPPNHPANQRSLLQPRQPSIQLTRSFPRQQQVALPPSPQRTVASTRKSPQTIPAAQRFHVNQPNYMQIYADYVKARTQSSATQRQSAQGGGRSAINRWQNDHQPPYLNPQTSNHVLYNREHSNIMPGPSPSIRAGSRYAISIKGIPGSSALAAIRNKAVTNPGFLSGLLSSRSQQYNRASQPISQLAPKRNKVMLNRARAVRPPSNRYQILANLPLTDRALIRTKIVRPNRWKTKLIDPSTTRTNIAYLPRSAFNRLPSWYRPRIGPALVKYVVKSKNRPQTRFDLGNKKQSMVRPTGKDIWQKIYSYYNNKNALQTRKMQELSKMKSDILTRQSLSAEKVARPQINHVVMGSSAVNVGSPLIRMRNNQYPNNRVMNELRNNERFELKLNTGLNTYEKEMPKNKDGNSKSIPPEIWDKRSRIRSFLISKKNTIPLRPTAAGNWGTLKKKRSAKSNVRYHNHHEQNIY